MLYSPLALMLVSTIVANSLSWWDSYIQGKVEDISLALYFSYGIRHLSNSYYSEGSF